MHGLSLITPNNMKKIYLIIILIAAFIFSETAKAEIVTLKNAKVRILVPTKWKYEWIDDEAVLMPPDSDFKVVFVTTAFRGLESAYQDAILGFEKITEKREIEINGMPAIFFRAKDIYDIDQEFRSFDWLYVLFKAPNGYVVNMCAGAESKSDVFYKYYIDINLIYKTLKPTEMMPAKKSVDKMLNGRRKK